MNTEEILSQLNDSQRQAVEYIDGPSLVIAGAGSGKTRVLTYKVAYLLQQGYKPWNILALTFTNKAANEMKQRIARLVGEESAKGLYMGTFHSIFARILRVEASIVGFQPNYTIYDETDARSLIKNIIKEMNLDDKTYKPATVGNLISIAKNHLLTAEDYYTDREAYERDLSMKIPETREIYKVYEQRCKQANAMDFDDLLLYTWKLFDSNEDIRLKYADRFRFILVDEYQDTNYAQQCIVQQLSSEHQHVCVVGDDAQSIYSFRGANIDNILGFQQQYDGCKLFKLERNYRSTQRIVSAANSLIHQNKWQIQKEVYSRNEEGEKLRYVKVYTDKEEALMVSREIRRIRRTEKAGYDDFAILYRTNAQSRVFEEQLLKDGIPYRIYGGLSFYQRKEVKDVFAYFRLVVNPNDEEAFRRVINYPARGIGATTLNKIVEAAHTHGVSLWTAASNPIPCGLSITKRTLEKIQDFIGLVKGFQDKVKDTDAFRLGNEIIETTGIRKEIIEDLTPEGLARKENVEELLSSIKDFVETRQEEDRATETSLTDFLAEVALYTDLDSGEEGAGKVSLMTIHSAKGLEFPSVFVVGLEENIFPSPMAKSPRAIEEERRLLYVAITRAGRHCILSSAQMRMRYGKMEFNPQSRFVRDLDSKYVTVDGGNASRTTSGSTSYTSTYTSSSTDRTAGSSPFGAGTFGSGSASWRDRADRFQNSRPVASQFRADPQPRAVPPRKPEPPVDPFSAEFRRLQEAHGGRLRPIRSSTQASPSSPSSPSTSSSPSSPSSPSLTPGSIIEHQRFGRGEVIKVEGTGQDSKATVRFDHAGMKQLLLKFARFTVVK